MGGMPKKDVWAVRVLASEGNYHMYRQLSEGRRIFLAAKLAYVALGYWRGHGEQPSLRQIALIKGPNQRRLHRRIAGLRNLKIGPIEEFVDYAPRQGAKQLPRFGIGETLSLLGLVARVLLMGRVRDLSLYLLFFFRVAQKFVNRNLSGVDTFLCYNDQPFDVAAFVHALERRGGCRTIVIQHGLILSPTYYFPTNAREFWAWGEASKKHFSTRNRNGNLIVTGRYAGDLQLKADAFHVVEKMFPAKVLAAFSFDHEEIYRGVDAIAKLRSTLPLYQIDRLKFRLKIHPATKRTRKLRSLVKKRADWLEVVDGDMEDLAASSDMLVTVNSTSAIDFMLLGKPTFFVGELKGDSYPSSNYGFNMSDFSTVLEHDPRLLEDKNAGRLNFLRESINV